MKEQPRQVTKKRIASIVIDGVNDTARQDKIINMHLDKGYKYIESVLLPGNQIIVRFDGSAVPVVE